MRAALNPRNFFQTRAIQLGKRFPNSLVLALRDADSCFRTTGTNTINFTRTSYNLRDIYRQGWSVAKITYVHLSPIPPCKHSHNIISWKAKSSTSENIFLPDARFECFTAVKSTSGLWRRVVM